MDKDSLFFRLLRLGLGIGRDKEVVASDTLNLDSSTPLRFAQNDIKGKHFTQNDTKGRCFTLDDTEAQLSIAQGVGAFIFDGLQKAVSCEAIPVDAVSKEIKMKLFSHTMQVEKLCRKQYALATELADIYARHGMHTVVLKGIAVGMCYPNPIHRPCGDLDCFLMGEYKGGNEVAREIGAEVDEHSYKHSHIKYKGLMVENHQFCTKVKGNQKRKRFERLLQNILAEEGTTRIGETHLETPSPLFNALFLTLHAREHLLLEGIALRHLCDWAMLLHKHGAEIDWERFITIADEYGIRRFADAMTRLSHDYIGIEIPVGYEVREDREREEYLMKEILYGGIEDVYASDKPNWMKRWLVAKNTVANAKRYRLFSDSSLFESMLMLAFSFLFDRKPKI